MQSVKVSVLRELQRKWARMSEPPKSRPTYEEGSCEPERDEAERRVYAAAALDLDQVIELLANDDD
jgi:hypothetical protein